MGHPLQQGTQKLARRYRAARRAEPSLSAEQFLARQSEADHDRGQIPRAQWIELLDVLRNAPEPEVDGLIDQWLEQQIPRTSPEASDSPGPSGERTRVEGDATLPLVEDPAATLKTEPAPPPPAENVQHIDRRYRIVRVLGEGAFGKVFLVQDKLQNDQELALKLIKKEHTATSEALVRFKNEILLLRVLNHPGIPQIFNDGMSEDGEFYYTMAYVAGRTLDDVIRKEAPLDPMRIVRITKQVLDVLDYAHARGAIHRDLKPGNIFLLHAGTPKEAVRVLDFGIAKVLSREGILEHAQTMNTEMPLGTPHYMSPEQVRGADVDGRTDLYALGVIIYQMCSGRFPFSGKTLMEILAARLERPPNPLEDQTTPAWLRELVMKLLERERERRPDTQSIRLALEQLQGSHRQLSNKLTWIAVFGAAALALIAWAVFGRGGGDPQKELSGLQGSLPATPGEQRPPEAQTPAKPGPEAGSPDPTVPKGQADREGEETGKGAPAPGPGARAENDGTGGASQEPQQLPEQSPVESAQPKSPQAPPAEAAPPALALLELDPPASPMPSFGPEVRRVRFSGRASRRLSAVHIGAVTVGPSANDPMRFEADVPLPDPPLDGRDVDLALKLELVELDTLERLSVPINYRRLGARIPAGCSPAPDAAVDERGRVTSILDGKSRIQLALVDQGPTQPGFYLGVREVSFEEWGRGPLHVLEWDAAQGDKPGTHPATGMSFQAAAGFCEQRGLRLPTAEEWEQAAKLAGGQPFPWGEQFKAGACNAQDPGDTFREAAPVGSFPEDRCGPFLDLAGNVQEWCAGPEGKPALRGGSWRLPPNACKLTAKGTPPREGSVSIGFRVAVSSTP
jgi:serine/threonine protein kinase